MTSKGRIVLRDILAMLEKCAPGHTMHETDHFIRVTWRDRVHPRLPTGEHGKRQGRAEIQIPHVRKLARTLGIVECAKAQIEALR
jgi:hypothetical protein